MKVYIRVVGGIGDILRAFDGLYKVIDVFQDDEIICLLYSHYKDAKNLFKFFPQIQTYNYYYSNNEELVNYLKAEKLKSIIDIEDFVENPHPQMPDLIEYYKKIDRDILPDVVKSNYIFGIHPFGSHFSNEFLTQRRNLPNKNIPVEQIIELIHQLRYTYPNSYFMIFGSESEKSIFDVLSYNIKEGLIPVFNDDIWLSFACADQCNAIIASDSAIKAYSLITHIPTALFVGDYADPIRDHRFINPYVGPNLYISKFNNSITHSNIIGCVDYIKNLGAEGKL